jgi:hypothetical protein
MFGVHPAESDLAVPYKDITAALMIAGLVREEVSNRNIDLAIHVNFGVALSADIAQNQLSGSESKKPYPAASWMVAHVTPPPFEYHISVFPSTVFVSGWASGYSVRTVPVFSVYATASFGSFAVPVWSAK